MKTVLLTAPPGQDPWMRAVRTCRSASFIEVYTDVGLVGLGETHLGYCFPEVVPVIVDFFKPILVGVEEIDVRALWKRMYRCGNFWCRNGMGAAVLAGVESALWDLKGKIQRKPIWELLGGKYHERLLAYASGGASDYPFEALLKRIDLFLEAGFRAAKFSSGWHDFDSGNTFCGDSVQAWINTETEKLELVRRHVGPDFVLCMDGNMANKAEGEKTWDLNTAKEVLKALESYDLYFFEEPLPYDACQAYCELRASTTIPVAGGEVFTTVEEFEQYANLNCLDIAQPDASFLGIGAFLEVASLFAKRGQRVATHAFGAGGSVMENVHAAFACPNASILEVPPLVTGIHTEVYGESFQMVDGWVLPPTQPGLGISLTEKTKERYPFVLGSGAFNSVKGKLLARPMRNLTRKRR